MFSKPPPQSEAGPPVRGDTQLLHNSESLLVTLPLPSVHDTQLQVSSCNVSYLSPSFPPSLPPSPPPSFSQELTEVNSGALLERMRKAIRVGAKHVKQCAVREEREREREERRRGRHHSLYVPSFPLTILLLRPLPLSLSLSLSLLPCLSSAPKKVSSVRVAMAITLFTPSTFRTPFRYTHMHVCHAMGTCS